jgi:carboxyl-terminal processing protease
MEGLYMEVEVSFPIFVPIAVEHGNENIVYLMKSGIVGNFVFEQLDRDRFKGLCFKDFVQKMNTTNLYFMHFQKELNKTDRT